MYYLVVLHHDIGASGQCAWVLQHVLIVFDSVSQCGVQSHDGIVILEYHDKDGHVIGRKTVHSK